MAKRDLFPHLKIEADEAQLIEWFRLEVPGDTAMLHVALTPQAAFQLALLLLRVLREDRGTAETRATASWLLVTCREHFRDCPAVLTLLDLLAHQ